MIITQLVTANDCEIFKDDLNTQLERIQNNYHVVKDIKFSTAYESNSAGIEYSALILFEYSDLSTKIV